VPNGAPLPRRAGAAMLVVVNPACMTKSERLAIAVLWWVGAAFAPLILVPTITLVVPSFLFAMVCAELCGIFCVWRLPYEIRTRKLCLAFYIPLSAPCIYFIGGFAAFYAQGPF